MLNPPHLTPIVVVYFYFFGVYMLKLSMQYKKYGLLISTVVGGALLLSACSRLPNQNAAASSQPQKTKTSAMIQKTFKNINALYVAGSAQLNLQPSKSNVSTLTYSRENQYQVTAQVKNHGLYLFANSKKHIPLNLSAPQLQQLTVYGNASVNGKNLKSKQLNIISHTNGEINLQGVLKLRKIHADHYGKIHIYWADSKLLTLNSNDNAKIILGGVANRLYIRANDHSEIDAKFLRAQHVRVYTKNQASVAVNPQQALYAFAHQYSHIYYYHTPRDLIRRSKQHANILAMPPAQ